VITPATLANAKAFLCWEVFDNLGIQLVPLRPAVAYYHPPQNNRHGIVLCYNPGAQDLSEALFLLFHEAGHARQWTQLQAAGRGDYFAAMLDSDRGDEKTQFEQKAWECGRELLERFADREHLAASVLAQYDLYGRACLLSYRDSAHSGERPYAATTNSHSGHET